jgi:hypothetical protein
MIEYSRMMRENVSVARMGCSQYIEDSGRETTFRNKKKEERVECTENGNRIFSA